MARPKDHTILNRVRVILDRLWIDADHLNFGSVNGTIYLQGDLRRNPTCSIRRADVDDDIRLLQTLEGHLRRIEGVKDVSLDLSGFRNEGEQWERISPRSA